MSFGIHDKIAIGALVVKRVTKIQTLEPKADVVIKIPGINDKNNVIIYAKLNAIPIGISAARKYGIDHVSR